MIKLGKFPKKLLYPILMGFFCFSAILCISLLRSLKVYEDSKQIRFVHPFIIIFVLFLSESVIFILYLIQTKNTKFQKEKEQLGKQYVDLLYNDDNANSNEVISKTLEILPGRQKLKLFIMICSLCLFEYSTTICSSILRETNVSLFELIIKVLLILFTTVLSRKILHYQYHKYHLFGCGVLLIGVIIFTVLEFSLSLVNISSDAGVIALYFGLSIAYQILTALQECSEKYLMDFKFVSPFVLISFEGFAGVFCLIISFIVLYFIQCPSETSYLCSFASLTHHEYENFFLTSKLIFSHYEYLLTIIGLFLSFMLFNTFRALTNFHFSPAHRAIADTFSFCLTWVAKLTIPVLGGIGTNSLIYYIFAFVAMLIMLCGVFIYLEIIIVNVCGIEMNTTNEILFRENVESKMCLVEQNEKSNKEI